METVDVEDEPFLLRGCLSSRLFSQVLDSASKVFLFLVLI